MITNYVDGSNFVLHNISKDFVVEFSYPSSVKDFMASSSSS